MAVAPKQPLDILKSVGIKSAEENTADLAALETDLAQRIESRRTKSHQSVHGTVTIAELPDEIALTDVHDSYGRHINYLRISLTDVCNLRCVYCMPEDMKFRPTKELMSDDEIIFLTKVAASLGVTKIRLTGGEPTIRPNVVEIVRQIAETPGIKDVAMTTNGLLLPKLAQPLADAGLNRVNISIDTVDPDKFRQLTRWGDIADVWSGIDASEKAGLTPIKLNCVVVRNFNDEDVIELARLTMEREWDVRFIEMMPFGEVSDFQQTNVVTFREIREMVESVFGPLEEAGYDFVDPSRPYKIPGSKGSLGFISSVTEPFCQGCGRVRFTADGKLRLCLLRDDEVDLLTPLRAGATFDEIRKLMADGSFHKPWGHGLADGVFASNRAMNQIGG